MNSDAPRGRRFQTTRWTLVLAARQPAQAGARDALSALCETYWGPVYAFIRRSGHDADAARDLTQSFFLRVLEKDVSGHLASTSARPGVDSAHTELR